MAAARSQQLVEWSQVAAFRLRRHHLAGKNQAGLADVTRDVCGVQAQVMSAAEIALWTRNHDLAAAAIQSALWKDRTLVKTSCMRGTLHLLAAADFPIYITALRSSRTRQALRVMARSGVTQREASEVTGAVVEALRAGPMTRRELTERVLSLGLAGKKAKRWFEQSWWGVVRLAIVEGLVCYGPDRGQQVTMVRADQWLPGKARVSEPEAGRILLRRYLRGYGPATLRDFSKWTSFSSPEAKAVWESLEEELAEVSVEGREAFILRQDGDELAASHLDDETVRLLPNFDPYLLAHADKNHLVTSRYYKRVYRQAGWVSPVVLLNGRVIGTWSYARRGKRLSLEVAPFENFSSLTRTRVEEEAAGLGGLLETPYEIKFRQPKGSL